MPADVQCHGSGRSSQLTATSGTASTWSMQTAVPAGVTMLSVMGLTRSSSATISGTARLDGTDLLAMPGDDLRKIRGRDVAPSDSLVVRNFRFFRNENDTKPVDKPDYKPGDRVWAKFDITGYKFGPQNKVDVSYVTSVLSPTGKVLWTQPEPAVEQSESFYPKRYIAADFGLNLQKTIKPGEYTIAVQVKDAISGETYETKQTFVVE